MILGQNLGNLIEKFKTSYDVINAINLSKLLFIKTKNPNGVEGPIGEIRGIGFKWVGKK